MIQTASYSNIGGRLKNEDAVRERQQEGGICVAVADGLGGHGGGEQASDMAVRILCEGWRGGAVKEELAGLVQEAHRQIQARQTELCAMKTTIAALAVKENRAAWVHAGDTRLYHFWNGILDFQTKDHSASQIAVTLGQITPDQIRFHEDRNRVLRALGQEGELKVEARDAILNPGKHCFLLCTDGFWEYVLETEMEECLGEASDPADWVGRMREILSRKVPQDNDNNTAAAVWIDR